MLKSRSGSKAGASSQVAQSIDDVRRRARYRLIGATILVLVGVVGFSLLFDSQPRPVAGLVPIEIPDRGDGKGSAAAANAQVDASASESVASSTSSSSSSSTSSDDREDGRPDVTNPSAGLDEGEEEVADSPAAVPASAPAPAPSKPVAPPAPPKPEPTKPKVAAPSPAPAKPVAAETTAAKATDPTGLRYVVQVGAFADASSVSRVRQKLEMAGLRTYTQSVDTPAGRRTRVRLGPFDTRANAEKAAARAKALGLPGRVLTL